MQIYNLHYCEFKYKLKHNYINFCSSLRLKAGFKINKYGDYFHNVIPWE